MSDLTLGILALILSSLFIYLAYRLGRAEKYDLAILLIVFAGLLLRLYASLDFFLHAWDERFHALIAKNLLADPLLPALYARPILGFDYRDWMSNYVWLHKPPFALWCIALSLKAFGIHEFAVRIPSLIFSSIGIFLTYRIGKLAFEERIGLLAAFFFATNGFLIDLCSGRRGTDHVDTAFIFLIQLGVYLSVVYFKSKKNILLPFIGLSTGMAILTRYLPGLIVLPVWIAFVWNKESRSAIFWKAGSILFFAGIIVLPWMIYTHAAFPQESAWVQQVNIAHLSEAIDQHKGSFFYHWWRIPRTFGLFSFIPIAVYIWLAIRRKISSSYSYGILVWFVVPYIFFSVVGTKLDGYVMIVAPAVFLMMAYSWWYLASNQSLIVRFLLFLVIAVPVISCVEELKIFTGIERNPDWVREIRSWKDKIGADQKDVVLFNVKHPIETMFYTPYVAYPFLPSEAQKRYLHQIGFTVVIIEGKQPRIQRPPRKSSGIPEIDNETRREDKALFESQSLPAAPWKRGQIYSITVKMTNRGNSIWQYPDSSGNYYYLDYAVPPTGLSCPVSPNQWDLKEVPIPAGTAVRPGETIAFQFRLKAPDAAGTFAIRWRMRTQKQTGRPLWFGNPTPEVCIPVL